MLSDARVQEALKSFVRVLRYYDGLGGTVIKWTLDHGNTSHDPSVLSWVLDPGGEELERPGRALYDAASFASWLGRVGRASFPLVDPAKYKEIRSEARVVAARGRIGSVLSKLRKMAGGGNDVSGPAQAEAKELVGRILEYAQWKLDRARSLEKTDPVEAFELYNELAVQFNGDQIGDDTRATCDALKKDSSFQKELKAQQILVRVLSLEKELNAGPPGRPLGVGSDEWKKQNRALLLKAYPLLATIVKRYPDTRAANKASLLIAAWKLE